jgi:hypothetical protein
MRSRRRDVGESAVVAECAAFLTGTLAERWEAEGLPVPVGVDQPSCPRQRDTDR